MTPYHQMVFFVNALLVAHFYAMLPLALVGASTFCYPKG